MEKTIAFNCSDCDKPVYVKNSYIKMGDLQFCEDYCLESHLIKTDVITVLEAE